MSSWDTTVFTDESNAEFLDECDDLEGADLVQALVDATTIALNGERPDDGEDADPDFAQIDRFDISHHH